MSRHELASALEWLNTTLTGDSTLLALAPGGVFADLAPDGTPTPYVTFGLQSPGNDSLTMNAVRVMATPLYQVIVTGPTSQMEAIDSASSELDDLLKRTSGTVAGGYIAACYREQPIEKSQLINTVQWKSLGGLYRLEIEQNT